jgi:hypothetical protein
MMLEHKYKIKMVSDSYLCCDVKVYNDIQYFRVVLEKWHL